MSGFRYVATIGGSGAAAASHVRDMAVWVEGGNAYLYTLSVGATVTLGTFTLAADAAAVQSAARTLGSPTGFDTPIGIDVVTTSGGPVVMTCGRSWSGARCAEIGTAGAIGAVQLLASDAGATEAPTALVGIGSNGLNRVYTANFGGSGLTGHALTAANTLTAPQAVVDTASTYAEGVVALAQAVVGADDYVIAASAEEAGVTAYRVGTGGQLDATGRAGVDEGLGLSVPNALTSVQAFGETYLILGDSGASSLSVIRLRPDGALAPTDHILDTALSRFAGAPALAAVTVGDRAFVVAAGADDGLSLFTLLPGGRLLFLDTMAWTPGLSL